MHNIITNEFLIWAIKSGAAMTAAVPLPLYLKNDAHDQLLFSEGVCRQLGIIMHHTLAEP